MILVIGKPGATLVTFVTGNLDGTFVILVTAQLDAAEPGVFLVDPFGIGLRFLLRIFRGPGVWPAAGFPELIFREEI